MKSNRKLEISLFETLTEKSLDLGIDLAELTVDQFLKNDFLKEIPFFSLYYKSIKTVQGIRDALFTMKIYKFVKEFERVKQNDKDDMLKKITFDQKEKIRVGYTLITVLDKINELDKTQLIVNIFAAYLKSEISISELTHLCSIVEKGFIDDLIIFSKVKKYSDIPLEIQANLASIGLMTPIIIDLKSNYGDSVIIKDDKNMLVYVANKLGIKMKKLVMK